MYGKQPFMEKMGCVKGKKYGTGAGIINKPPVGGLFITGGLLTVIYAGFAHSVTMVFLLFVVSYCSIVFINRDVCS